MQDTDIEIQYATVVLILRTYAIWNRNIFVLAYLFLLVFVRPFFPLRLLLKAEVRLCADGGCHQYI